MQQYFKYLNIKDKASLQKYQLVDQTNFNSIKNGDYIRYIIKKNLKFRKGGCIYNILDNTTSGQAVINEVLFQFSMHDLPFGGVGPSGMGAYHGYDGFKNFSHKRSVLKGQNLINAGSLVSAPYSESTEKNIRRLS